MSVSTTEVNAENLPSGSVENANPRKRLHLSFLDGMRALAALYVVLFHLWQRALSFPQDTPFPHWFQLTSLVSHGHMAVDVFIVLSGFCLMLPVVQSGSDRVPGGIKDYLLRRARRILPPYYAALGISFILLALLPSIRQLLLTNSPYFPGTVISHLFLIHNLNANWVYRINGPMWSVATEWQIYFLFPLLLLPIRQRLGTVAAIIVGFALGLASFHLHLANAHFWYIGLFAMGMLAAEFGLAPKIANRSWLMFGAAMIVLSLLTLSTHSRGSGDTQPFNDLWIGCFATCFLVFCTRSLNQETSTRASFLVRWLSLRWLTGLGAFSYSLYLIHMPVIGLFVIALKDSHATAVYAYEILMLGGLPAILVTSYLFHLAFERPFLRSRSQKDVLRFAKSSTDTPAA